MHAFFGDLAVRSNSLRNRPRIQSGAGHPAKRCMSSIAVFEAKDDLQVLPVDMSEGWKEGAFAGGYAGPAPSCSRTPEDRMAGRYAAAETPRLNSVRIKTPMNFRPRPGAPWAIRTAKVPVSCPPGSRPVNRQGKIVDGAEHAPRCNLVLRQTRLAMLLCKSSPISRSLPGSSRRDGCGFLYRT